MDTMKHLCMRHILPKLAKLYNIQTYKFSLTFLAICFKLVQSINVLLRKIRQRICQDLFYICCHNHQVCYTVRKICWQGWQMSSKVDELNIRSAQQKTNSVNEGCSIKGSLAQIAKRKRQNKQTEIQFYY